MAGFVDCGKYKADQTATSQALENLADKDAKQDEKLKELEKRGIMHDDTLTGDGLTDGTKLGVKKSMAAGNAVNTDDGVFVKDLGPQVEELENNWKDLNNRLSGDLTNGIKAVNDKLNKLKEIEVALNAAKAEGNYKKIKDLEAQLAAAKQAEDLANKSLADAIDSLRKQGLSDSEIQKIINDSLAKAGGQGRHLTDIQVNQATGDVTYVYSDGTRLTGKLTQFQGVVVDNNTIHGDGLTEALHIRVSQARGNQIKFVNGELFAGYGNGQHLYVSNDGDDNNVGTRDKPLRTISEALSRIENKPGFNQVSLHENHTFDLGYSDIRFAEVLFSTYGPTVDSQYPEAVPNNVYYRGYVAKDYPRAIINVRVHKVDGINMVRRDAVIADVITLRGVAVKVYNKYEGVDSDIFSGNFTGAFDAAQTITVHGTTFEEMTKAKPLNGPGAYRNDVILRGEFIRWIDSKMLNDGLEFISTSYTGSLIFITWNSGRLDAYGSPFPNHESLIPANDQFDYMSEYILDRIHGVYKDPARHLYMGLNINIDPFKGS